MGPSRCRDPHQLRGLSPGPMILTPIATEALPHILDPFIAGLMEPFARAAFRRICATSPDRVVGAEAERHRLVALSFERDFGTAIHPEGTACHFNRNGTALNGATDAYVILHEVAHFAFAPPARRGLIDFGL